MITSSGQKYLISPFSYWTAIRRKTGRFTTVPSPKTVVTFIPRTNADIVFPPILFPLVGGATQHIVHCCDRWHNGRNKSKKGIDMPPSRLQSDFPRNITKTLNCFLRILPYPIVEDAQKKSVPPCPALFSARWGGTVINMKSRVSLRCSYYGAEMWLCSERIAAVLNKAYQPRPPLPP